ncbi:FAD-binding and (Fe-S)-binding domain-containing protein [Nocardioides sp. AE5]|uniref:FAD-binding and (Fe-S)-binding domain-containing protein n=1 Tax=Nocardioides sp. AE5 TaxID=2962573 RepID=UPI002882D3D7|nr:FAD-binding and (Fe-S)-binding domain-containing protein [Nocardioides sp. AE5]MDT0200768.1 FAD-binding and (Fe-S)-binding domain-containing protein [Nocardioides sp. AE5]
MGPDTQDLLAALRRAGVTDASAATLDRALYSSDASLYRVVPTAVARPRSRDELLACVAVARGTGTPVTMRGAGTSIAGNAVGAGLVIDTARHLGQVLHLDPEARTAVVQPGTVHATVQRQALAAGLRFGPDPSTHTRCTIGGMIGNNACGSRALGFGRTVDNVAGMDVVLGTGEEVRLGPGSTSRAGTDLAALVDADLGHVRTHFGRFSRQVSGYGLEHLLPENGRRLDRFLVGSEGTLGVVLEATVDLVVDPPATVLAVLGYRDMASAADAVPAVLAAGSTGELIACEGLDARIVDVLRGAGRSVPDLPRGAGWLFVEVAADNLAEAEASAARLVAAAGPLEARIVTARAEQAALWRIREDGAGLAARSLARPAYSGWEDAAVPPEHLGAWLRDFEQLLGEHGLDGVPYGHFGDGCVHVRIDFDFDDGGARFRRFLTDAATQVAAYGGSLSGEHGDGRARSELLPLMYDERSLALFGAIKQVCDPDNLLNPGVLVDPAPLDADLRPARPVAPVRSLLALAHDGGFLGAAVHRCTGVGKCVADNAPSGGVMCPSYAATRDEKDSTRGRARVLQEALDGSLVAGLASPEVAEALDLCLSCKGCARDCPTGVDMATYKSEVLHQTYAGKRRPRSHYALGQLPRWARMTARLAPAANAALRVGPLARLAKAVAGIDQRRGLPQFARRTLRRSTPTNAHSLMSESSLVDVDVWLWADSFTDHFVPETGRAAIEVLEAAGLRVGVIDERACCGLTWITTGQLTAARKIVTRAVATLTPYVESGVPVIGLEPSCLASLRSDAAELVPGAGAVGERMLTLAEFLATLGEWSPPDLTGVEIVAQPHCHHASVLGWEADEALLRRAGATVKKVGGCCGLAGNFGVEKGHYETSVAIAEHALLPAVRTASPGAVVLADGMSCRIQLDDLAGVPALHLAQLLASRLP